MSTEDVVAAVAASSLSELCWVARDGQPQVRGVVALVRGERPALAFTYADEAVARDVAAAYRLVLALGETRSTGGAFRPLLLSGRPRLVEDPTGELFVDEMLTQELRRYPPSRVYADSPLLMREHWWYLPRLIVEVDLEAAEPLPPRSPTHDHVLVVADGTTPVVRRAGIVRDTDQDPAAAAAPRPGGQTADTLALAVDDSPAVHGPAVLFGQDASFPDLEQWAQWRYRGTWDGKALAVHEAPSRTGLGRPAGLLHRWRRQRALAQACVQAIPDT